MEDSYKATAIINGEVIDINENDMTLSNLLKIENSNSDFYGITLKVINADPVNISPFGMYHDYKIENASLFQGEGKGSLAFYTSPRGEQYRTDYLLTKIASKEKAIAVSWVIKKEGYAVNRPYDPANDVLTLSVKGMADDVRLSGFSLFPTIWGWLKDNNLTMYPLTLVSTVFGGAALLRKKQD